MVANRELKALLEATKRESRLLGPVERHLLTRKPEHRRQDVLHPSEMAKDDWCPRQAQWTVMHHEEHVPSRPNLRLSNIFAEGHYIHAKWQRWLGEMGVLYGKWFCPNCGGSTWAVGLMECPDCLVPCDYREVPLSLPELHLSGHADGWVRGLGEEDFLIEIKSIGTGTIRIEDPRVFAAGDGDLFKAWREVRRPFPTHVRQAQIYAEIIRRMAEAGVEGVSHPVRGIVFIYELKADQDAKEFTVKPDFEYVRGIFEHVEDIAWAIERGRLVPCPHGGCDKCKGIAE